MCLKKKVFSRTVSNKNRHRIMNKTQELTNVGTWMTSKGVFEELQPFARSQQIASFKGLSKLFLTE